MNRLIFLIFILILYSCAGKNTENNSQEWVKLFNEKNLDDWHIKFNHFEAGENYKNTFKVINGKLVVDYSEYDSINDEFGHIYYKKPFSKYKLRLEYRFIGDQVEGGPGWAYRNNGIMFHCQDPETVLKDQPFPVSLEVQLLGAGEAGERSTANLCTPGTHVIMNEELVTQHCISSSSKTFRGDDWIQIELVVFSDSLIYHIVEGDTVLSYSHPQIGGDLPENYPFPEGFSLTDGYIALQAESHPTEFRNIELMELE